MQTYICKNAVRCYNVGHANPCPEARVLDYVTRTSRVLSAAQIAAALGMTAPAVRHHLAILQIRRADRACAGAAGAGPGPALACDTGSPRALAGNNLAMLAEHLLSAWRSGSPAARARKRSGRWACAQARASSLQPARRSIERLPQVGSRRLVERLNQLHYGRAGRPGPRGRG